MGPSSKGTTFRDKSTEKGGSSDLMALAEKETSLKTIYMEKVLTNEVMDASILETDNTTKWKGNGHLHGSMEGRTLGTT